MERDRDASGYVTVESQQKHRDAFTNERIRYLTIDHDGDCAGFIILAIEPETNSVECRRIVVADKGRGTGAEAITAMESYCRKSIGCERIWLDVFTNNGRAHHLYSKLGYREYKRGFYRGGEYDGRELIFMEKYLDGRQDP